MRVLDLTHGVRAHDVRAGALTLWRCARWLRGSVVLAVVDPGVGTARRPVAVGTGDGDVTFVGPDNGLLMPALCSLGGAVGAVELRRAPVASGLGATFDGRDVFAPAAARLASGEWSLGDAGVEVDPAGLVGDAVAMATVGAGGRVDCEVLWVDRFGNAQLNTRGDGVGDVIEVDSGGAPVVARRVRAFGELADGEVGLVTDSYGLLALALNGSPAASRLGLREGDAVRLSTARAGERRR